MRREGTNIVELGTQILDRINTPVTSADRTRRSGNGRLDNVSCIFVFKSPFSL